MNEGGRGSIQCSTYRELLRKFLSVIIERVPRSFHAYPGDAVHAKSARIEKRIHVQSSLVRVNIVVLIRGGTATTPSSLPRGFLELI